MTPPEAQRLADALLALPPREAQLLLRAARAERPLEAIGAAHGVDPARAAVLLWEALERLDAQLHHEAWRPLAWPEAKARATALEKALAAGPSTPSAQRLFELKRELAAVQEALAGAQRREDEAPARTVEAWLRRLAIAAILAITAWSYLHH